MLFTCQRVPPPTDKSRILVCIQKAILTITTLYAIFLLASTPAASLLHFCSALLLIYAFTQLSYFCCFVLVTLDSIRLLQLMSSLAVQFQNEQLANRIEADTMHRIALFVFCTNCIFFNFSAYREYKSIALEVLEESQLPINHSY